MSRRCRLRTQQLHAWLCPSFPAGPLRLGWSGGDSSLCCQTISVPGAKDLGGFVPAPIHTAFSLQTKTQGLVTERCCYGYANGDEGTILNWGHQCDCSLHFLCCSDLDTENGTPVSSLLPPDALSGAHRGHVQLCLLLATMEPCLCVLSLFNCFLNNM